MTSEARRRRGGKAKKEENESNLLRVRRHRGQAPKLPSTCSSCGKKSSNIAKHHGGGNLCPKCHHKANKRRGEKVN